MVIDPKLQDEWLKHLKRCESIENMIEIFGEVLHNFAIRSDHNASRFFIFGFVYSNLYSITAKYYEAPYPLDVLYELNQTALTFCSKYYPPK